MREIICRVLLLSDFHKLSVPVGKQKGQNLKFLEKIAEGIINIWKRWNMKYAIPKMMHKLFCMTAQQGEKFDLQIINGDVIECEYNERGIMMEVDRQELRRMINTITSGVALEKTFVVAGDHELGYRLPLSTDPKGGISPQSIDNFVHVVGPLWQTFSIEKIHFLLLNSSLMIQKTDHLSLVSQERIERLRIKQQAFVISTLEKIAESETVFVFLHDPDAIVEFNAYIRDFYYVHNKNFTVFCGHMHAEFSLLAYKKLGELASSKYAFILPAKILKWAKSNGWRLQLFEKYDLQIIPAPGGMMGIGGGFKVLNIHKDGTFEVRKCKT
ncbi:MAG: hypothetical protein ACD_8C00083G0004 [uncultured bacterium]|nr:MAG: hypothetical protein ACD_8C00083G0004 [uncultured bacterium]